jgi:hypothetical protein
MRRGQIVASCFGGIGNGVKTTQNPENPTPHGLPPAVGPIWSYFGVFQTDPTKEGESGGFEEESKAQAAECLRRVLRSLSVPSNVLEDHHRPP